MLGALTVEPHAVLQNVPVQCGCGIVITIATAHQSEGQELCSIDCKSHVGSNNRITRKGFWPSVESDFPSLLRLHVRPWLLYLDLHVTEKGNSLNDKK